MNRSIIRSAQIAMVVCLVVCGAVAQSSVKAADRFKISAKAGMINYSEGLTSVSRVNGTTDTLIIGDQLNSGDKVLTSVGGMAEVLLNPGSYIRLGAESEFSFRTTSLDDLRLSIHKGSAILEVFASNQFKVTAVTPKSRVTIVNTGVYRIDIGPDGTGLLSVIEGKAIAGERNVAIIKDGRTGTLDGNAVEIGKFDKGKRDGLASWSRLRSKDLAKMASAFNARNTRPILMDSLIDSYMAGTWGRNRTMGVWVWSSSLRTCVFIPYYSDWASPYGFGYRACMCNYYFPPNIVPIHPPVRLDGAKDSAGLVFGGSGGSKTTGRGVDIESPTKRSDVIFTSREPAYSPPPPVRVLTGNTKRDN